MARTSRESNLEFGKSLARAFAGAVIFGLPLFMTMEMWWLGFHVSPWRQGPPPFWERVTAAVGLALVLACIGYLTYHAIAGKRDAPAPVLEVEAVEERNGTALQYLPGDSWREGGLFFTRYPRDFELELGPEGYHKP